MSFPYRFLAACHHYLWGFPLFGVWYLLIWWQDWDLLDTMARRPQFHREPTPNLVVFLQSFSHGHLHPMLWGCGPIVIFHSQSTVSQVPTLQGCIPVVVLRLGFMGTSTLCCRDVSLWSYFILDLVVSLGTHTPLLGTTTHHFVHSSFSRAPTPYVTGPYL